jgi:hypothetical protein
MEAFNMKKFEHDWSSEYFLLHIQLNNYRGSKYIAKVIREYDGGLPKEEIVNVDGTESHRFIVSRTHPKELRFVVEYPDDIILEAFKVDDRAYYPTESFFRA